MKTLSSGTASPLLSALFLSACAAFSVVAGNAQQAVTTPGGTTGYIPKFTGAATIAKSLIFDTGTTVGIGVGASPNSSVKLDVGGGMIIRGNTIVARMGNATASKGYPSWGFQFFANTYNSSTKAVGNPYFVLQSEPTGNNTASPAATFNVLFSNNGAVPGETGFYINPNGTLHFASAQTFPIAAGPQGPAGPTGPQGPQGPAGAITLPYVGTATSNNTAAFTVSNTGVSEYQSANGIEGNGGSSGVGSGGAAGIGVIGFGGFATPSSSSTDNNSGGAGVYGQGGSGNSQSTDDTSGGFGGFFFGGDAGGTSSGTGGTGVRAVGGTPNGVGLIASGSGTASAAVFYGDVYVDGTLSKSGGSFKIDDPIDPANKYLSHSFVESPDMMNIYNGNAVTDGRGEAVVTMPAYFEALNRDFRYQLTVIGQFAQAIVGSEIAGRSFTIRTDKPNVKVSWMVTGIRQDAWANAHRIPEEEDKPEEGRGKYLNPELFGHLGEANILENRHGHPQKNGTPHRQAPQR